MHIKKHGRFIHQRQFIATLCRRIRPFLQSYNKIFYRIVTWGVWYLFKFWMHMVLDFQIENVFTYMSRWKISTSDGSGRPTVRPEPFSFQTRLHLPPQLALHPPWPGSSSSRTTLPLLHHLLCRQKRPKVERAFRIRIANLQSPVTPSPGHYLCFFTHICNFNYWLFVA